MEMQRQLEAVEKNEVFRHVQLPPIIPVDHHLAHAAASFYASGFDEAAILVVDGQGECVSTTIAHGKGSEIHMIQSFDVTQSLGYFYEAVSLYCGLGRDSAGKLMGLAPYGQPIYKFSNI
jgi:carbamoyltransferase